jgi:hypothetical protein
MVRHAGKAAVIAISIRRSVFSNKGRSGEKSLRQDSLFRRFGEPDALAHRAIRQENDTRLFERLPHCRNRIGFDAGIGPVCFNRANGIDRHQSTIRQRLLRPAEKRATGAELA